MNTPSAKSVALIEKFETGGDWPTKLSWPGGQSGITLGCGYDCGYATAAQIQQDWSALPEAVVHRLMSYAGTTGPSAQRLLVNCSDIVIPVDVSRHVFETIDIPRTSATVSRAFPNTALLSGDSFGALVSLVFNRGAGMTDTVPGNRLEMREIYTAMESQEFFLIPQYIRDMKRLWQGKGLDGLLARRDAEADLFEQGLQPAGGIA